MGRMRVGGQGQRLRDLGLRLLGTFVGLPLLLSGTIFEKSFALGAGIGNLDSPRVQRLWSGQRVLLLEVNTGLHRDCIGVGQCVTCLICGFSTLKSRGNTCKATSYSRLAAVSLFALMRIC